MGNKILRMNPSNWKKKKGGVLYVEIFVYLVAIASEKQKQLRLRTEQSRAETPKTDTILSISVINSSHFKGYNVLQNLAFCSVVEHRYGLA